KVWLTQTLSFCIVPTCFNVALLERLTKTLTLKVTEFREDGRKYVADGTSHIKIAELGLPIQYLERVKPKAIEIKISQRPQQLLQLLINVLMIGENNGPNSLIHKLPTDAD